MTAVDAASARFLELDRSALVHTGALVARVAARDLAPPTPCAAGTSTPSSTTSWGCRASRPAW